MGGIWGLRFIVRGDRDSRRGISSCMRLGGLGTVFFLFSRGQLLHLCTSVSALDLLGIWWDHYNWMIIDVLHGGAACT